VRLIAIFLFLAFSTQAFSQGNVGRTRDFFNALKDLGQPPSACNEQIVLANYKKEKPVTYKDIKIRTREEGKANYEGLRLSVMSKEEAQKLFEQFQKLSYIPNKYLEDGCYARAHELALIAKNNGITMGKAFMLPHSSNSLLYPKSVEKGRLDRDFDGWKYHAVSFVLVKNGNRVEPFVFDLGVSPKIQSFSEWKQNLSSNPQRARIVVKDSAQVFHDVKFDSKDRSIIDRLQETQDLIDKLGMDEYKFQLGQGWL
jgi:hypothetical protein